MQNSTDVKKAPTRAGTLFWLVLLTMLLHTSWFVLLYAIPMQKKQFVDREIGFPAPMTMVLGLSASLHGDSQILIPLSVVILWSGLILTRHVVRNRRVGMVFTIIATLGLVGLTAILLLCSGLAVWMYVVVTAR